MARPYAQVHRPLREECHGNFNAHEEAHENKQGWSGFDPGADPQALGNDDRDARRSRRSACPQARAGRSDRGSRWRSRRRARTHRPGGTPAHRPRGRSHRYGKARTPGIPVTVLDAYALIAYVIGGPAQEQVIALLRGGKCTIATANLIEVFDVVGRQHGYPVGRVAEIIDPLFATTLSVVHLDEHLAQRAGELRVEHYHRSRSPLSLADVILIASAQPGDRIATADPDVLATASSLGIETVELPGQG